MSHIQEEKSGITVVPKTDTKMWEDFWKSVSAEDSKPKVKEEEQQPK